MDAAVFCTELPFCRNQRINLLDNLHLDTPAETVPLLLPSPPHIIFTSLPSQFSKLMTSHRALYRTCHLYSCLSPPHTISQSSTSHQKKKKKFFSCLLPFSFSHTFFSTIFSLSLALSHLLINLCPFILYPYIMVFLMQLTLLV